MGYHGAGESGFQGQGVKVAYTAADLEKIREAKMALATGQRVTAITFANGKRMEFANADLKTLEAVEGQIAAELSAAAGEVTYVRFTSSKGL
jgi:hypothetical protein